MKNNVRDWRGSDRRVFRYAPAFPHFPELFQPATVTMWAGGFPWPLVSFTLTNRGRLNRDGDPDRPSEARECLPICRCPLRMERHTMAPGKRLSINMEGCIESGLSGLLCWKLFCFEVGVWRRGGFVLKRWLRTRRHFDGNFMLTFKVVDLVDC